MRSSSDTQSPNTAAVAARYPEPTPVKKSNRWEKSNRLPQVKNNRGRELQEQAPPARNHVRGMACQHSVDKMAIATDDDPDRGRRGDGGSWQAAQHGHPSVAKGNKENKGPTIMRAGRIRWGEARTGDEGGGVAYSYLHP